MTAYASWHATASGSGAAGLAAITDAAYLGDPAGTQSNKAYWEARAYDILRAILLELGSDPSGGINDQIFILNKDNTTNDAEDSFLRFSRGIAAGADAQVKWNSTTGKFEFNYDVAGNSVDFGVSTSRIKKVWATDIDVATKITTNDIDVTGTLDIQGTLTSTGDVGLGGNLNLDGTVLTLNADVTGAPVDNIELVVERGTSVDAKVRWDETGDDWQKFDVGSSTWRTIVAQGESGVLTDTMLASGIYGGTGSATTISRSDHTHGGGTTDSTGTNSDTFTLDADVDSADYVYLYFQGSTRKLGIDPTGNDIFEFSKGIGSSIHNSFDIGLTGNRFRDLFLGRNADIDGTLNVAGNATFQGDVDVQGAVTGDLDINGTILTLDADAVPGAASLIRVPLASGHASLKWTGTVWQYSNDGTTFHDIVGADNANLASPTLTGTISSTGIFTQMAASAVAVLLNSGQANADAKLSVYRNAGSANSHLQWSNSNSRWQMVDPAGTWEIVGRTKTQTLTNKTLSQPTIESGGTWTGDPALSGNPAFSGTPAFTGVPAFNKTGISAPFTVLSTWRVDNLNADLIDGLHGASYLSKSGSDYLATGTLDMNGNTITNISGGSFPPSAHKTNHQVGGGDEFTGLLGTANGTNAPIWRISAGLTTTAARLYFGQTTTSDYFVGIAGVSPKMIGVGASAVHLVPGAASGNQDLGTISRQWRTVHLKESALFQMISTVEPAGVINGSLWAVDASSTNGFRAGLKCRFGGASLRIIDNNNKTDMVGCAGVWDVGGNLQINDNKFYLDADENSYIQYRSTGGGVSGLDPRIVFILDSTEEGHIDLRGFINA